MNQDIKQMIRAARVYQWEVAAAFGVSESTFVKMLRHKLSDAKREKVLQIIKNLKEALHE